MVVWDVNPRAGKWMLFGGQKQSERLGGPRKNRLNFYIFNSKILKTNTHTPSIVTPSPHHPPSTQVFPKASLISTPLPYPPIPHSPSTHPNRKSQHTTPSGTYTPPSTYVHNSHTPPPKSHSHASNVHTSYTPYIDPSPPIAGGYKASMD